MSGFKADARGAIQALENVSAAVEVGVVYADYAKRVADAKVAVDRFLSSWPVDMTPPLRSSTAGAMVDFAIALELWSLRVKGTSWIPANNELAPKLLSMQEVTTRRIEAISIGDTHIPAIDVIDLESAQQAVWARALSRLGHAKEMTR